MKKKLLAIFLALCFALSLMPMTALAAESTATEITSETTTLASGSYYLGENVTVNGGTLAVPADVSATIDLCGYTLTAQVIVSGKLSIIDSTANGEPLVSEDGNYNVTYTSGKITSSGTTVEAKEGGSVTLKSGTVESTGNIALFATGDTSGQSQINSTINVEGGYVLAQEFAASPQGNGATLNITGGVLEAKDNAVVGGNGTKTETDDRGGYTINVNGGVLVSRIITSGYVSCGIYHPNAGIVNVTDGIIISTNGAGIVARAGTTNITGGTIIAMGDADLTGKVGDSRVVVSTSGVVLDLAAKYPGAEYDEETQKATNAKINISGEVSISGSAAAVNVVENYDGVTVQEDDNIVISSGTFSSNINAAYLVDNVDLIANSDGTYSVGEVTAENAAAQVGNNRYGTLEAAIAAATDGQTVIMLKDLTIYEKQIISTGITLDLGDNTLTIAGPNNDDSIYVAPAQTASTAINVTIQNGTITDIRGQGKTALGVNTVFAQGLVNLTTRNLTVEAYAPVGQASPYYNYLLRINPDLLGAGANAKVGTLTLESGTNLVELDNGGEETYGVVGISVIGPYINSNVSEISDDYTGVTLVVKDGVSVETTGYALCGNGSAHGTTITIEGGSLISHGSTAIYHPQAGTMTINGNPVITGESAGIEIRAGKVTVNGGTISGLAVPTEVTPNGNGTTSSGAGIAVAQHTTKLPIKLTINGGTINGYSALYESNPQGNGAEYLEKIELSVVNGTFNATNGGAQAVYSEDKAGFISGGSFSTDPSAYVASNYIAVAKNGMYGIETASAEAARVVAGNPNVNAADEIDQTVTTALAGIEAEGLTGEANSVANNNTVTTEEGKAALEAESVTVSGQDNVTIVVQPYLDIQVTAYTATEDTTPNTMTLDITPKVRTVATTADVENGAEIYLETAGGNSQNAVQIGEDDDLEVSTPITLTIPLPSGFANESDTVYIQHKEHEYEATAVKGSDDSLSITFVNPYGFSEFVLSTSSSTVATIGTEHYTTLQAAVDDAAAGATIEVVKAGTYNATANKTVSVKNSTNTGGSEGSSITVSINGNQQTIAVGESHTFTYSVPSVPTYAITVESADNGAVTASASRAAAGSRVTLTVAPSEGYVLDNLTVTDGSGNALTLTETTTGYTFTMPASAVTVTATFVEGDHDCPSDHFTDVDLTSWYHDALDYVIENGLMIGTSDTTFEPGTTMNRAMLAQILYNMEGQPEVTGESAFTDVTADDWYHDAVVWAAENGIVLGYSDTEFGPLDAISREQFAVMLYRYADFKGLDTSASGDLSSFTDAESISDWATEAVTWAVGAEVLRGYGDGILNPIGGSTRAEAAQMLYNYSNAQ